MVTTTFPSDQIIDKDINPYVDQWEAEGVFPAHSLFKKLGDAGLMGITRPVEHGGLGLDYSYSMAYFEELANINCAGIPSAIMVQSEVAMPALVSFASDYLKKEFLEPSIRGDVVACIGISEISGGSDVAALKTTAKREGDDLVINGMKVSRGWWWWWKFVIFIILFFCRGRCGSPTALRRTGCPCWPTPATARCTGTSRSSPCR